MRQLRDGFPWLTFVPELESAYRQTVLEEHVPHIRVNLGLVMLAIGAVSAMRLSAPGPAMSAVPVVLRALVMVPLIRQRAP